MAIKTHKIQPQIIYASRDANGYFRLVVNIIHTAHKDWERERSREVYDFFQSEWYKLLLDFCQLYVDDIVYLGYLLPPKEMRNDRRFSELILQ